MILPVAREVAKRDGRLKVDESVVILVPELASSSDLFLASFLSGEMATRYGMPLRVRRTRIPVRRWPSGRSPSAPAS